MARPPISTMGAAWHCIAGQGNNIPTRFSTAWVMSQSARTYAGSLPPSSRPIPADHYGDIMTPLNGFCSAQRARRQAESRVSLIPSLYRAPDKLCAATLPRLMNINHRAKACVIDSNPDANPQAPSDFIPQRHLICCFNFSNPPHQ
jgi:hypothetical protein